MMGRLRALFRRRHPRCVLCGMPAKVGMFCTQAHADEWDELRAW